MRILGCLSSSEEIAASQEGTKGRRKKRNLATESTQRLKDAAVHIIEVLASVQAHAVLVEQRLFELAKEFEVVLLNACQ